MEPNLLCGMNCLRRGMPPLVEAFGVSLHWSSGRWRSKVISRPSIQRFTGLSHQTAVMVPGCQQAAACSDSGPAQPNTPTIRMWHNMLLVQASLRYASKMKSVPLTIVATGLSAAVEQAAEARLDGFAG